MKTFNQIFQTISEASVRQGLPSVSTMTHSQFSDLVGSGKVHVDDVTEKTDGQTFVIGHDHHGFYTQNSASGDQRMRSADDYVNRAKSRSEQTGKPLHLTGPHAFGKIHTVLANNQKLRNHLEGEAAKNGGHVKLRGELFNRHLSSEGSRKGEIKFVGTSYHSKHLAKDGMVVIHSKLPDNQIHNVDKFKNELSDHNINFDHDKIDHKPSTVDVSKHKQQFDKLDHTLLNSRMTKTNKQAKLAEIEKFENIKKDTSKTIDDHVATKNIKPKWGRETEGLVIHPTENSSAPRFKVLSQSFKNYRKQYDGMTADQKRDAFFKTQKDS